MQQSIGLENAITTRQAINSCGCYCCISSLVGVVCCTPLYLGTLGFGCGYCQGQECGKCRQTECLDGCSGD
jgi:hypothetical protein